MGFPFTRGTSSCEVSYDVSALSSNPVTRFVIKLPSHLPPTKRIMIAKRVDEVGRERLPRIGSTRTDTRAKRVTDSVARFFRVARGQRLQSPEDLRL